MEATNRCPFCAEEILAKAVKCKHCGSMLDGSTPRVTRDPQKKSRTAERVLIFTGLTVVFAIFVFVASAVYAGHLESGRAISAVQKQLGESVDVDIFSYRHGVGENYVCGMAFPKGKPASAGKLFYVVEQGTFPHVTAVGIDGDSNFSEMYIFTCGNGHSTGNS